ncbi:hypothetical protein [Enterococcus gallinarum]|uniref:hypothetical protein n=1 Tax=Enterococcus gallinarum TaxID=1353 RepID=UPI0035E1ACD0
MEILPKTLVNIGIEGEYIIIEPLQKVSFILLSQESAEAKQIIHQLVNSRFKQQEELSISIIPFLSSVCDGWLSFFQSQNIDMELSFIENISFDKLVKSTRVSYKLYSDKKQNKINNKLQDDGLKRLYLLKTEYNFIQRKFVELFGQRDLGVFTLDGIPYGNTSQLSIYLEKIIDFNSATSLTNLQKNSALFLTKYSECIASLINCVVTPSFQSGIDKKKTLILELNRLSHHDYFFYDEQRKNLLGGCLPTNTQLFLFNILCQNNFVNKVLPIVFQTSGVLYFRSKLQTYLVSVNCLSLILKRYSYNINKNQISNIKNIIEEKERIFTFENKLRNNIFHYDIQDVPISIFNDSLHYFEEMLEYCTMIDFNSLISIIDQSFLMIDQIIRDLIKYEL